MTVFSLTSTLKISIINLENADHSVRLMSDNNFVIKGVNKSTNTKTIYSFDKKNSNNKITNLTKYNNRYYWRF